MADTPNDPILLVLQQLQHTQADQVRKQDAARDEIHETRRALDTLTERLSHFMDMPQRLTTTEMLAARHGERITGMHTAITMHAERLATLETQAAQAKGWQTPAGKLAMALAGALIAGLVGAALLAIGVRPARAASDASVQAFTADDVVSVTFGRDVFIPFQLSST